MYETLIDFVRSQFPVEDVVPLHVPRFGLLEAEYVNDTLATGMVSSAGAYVDRFEKDIEVFTGASAAVATVNGTTALNLAMHLVGVSHGDLVITPSLTFIAACSAIHHMGARPMFADVSLDSFGLCPRSLAELLEARCWLDDDGNCRDSETGAIVRAVIPMHTFGHAVQMDEIYVVCETWGLPIIEDAAESLGSYYGKRHTGTIGRFGVLSFNGNKVITTGGGGMLLCADPEDGARAKYLSTTAKRPHRYEYFHDEAGFNYRLPNLNAALGVAQLERLNELLFQKRALAEAYARFLSGSDLEFVTEPSYGRSNYWLNGVVCADRAARNRLLDETNSAGILARPIWQLMHTLPMFEGDPAGALPNSKWLVDRIVNLPSSVPSEPV